MKLIIFCFISLVVSRSFAESAQSNKIYAVIFQILIEQGKGLTKCEVTKVIDKSKGPDPVKIVVSEKYKKAACRLFASKKPYMKDGKTAPFFSYYLMDPSNPDEVITK